MAINAVELHRNWNCWSFKKVNLTFKFQLKIKKHVKVAIGQFIDGELMASSPSKWILGL